MREFTKVAETTDLFRDNNTSAIVYTDSNATREAKERKKKRRQERDEIDNLRKDVEDMKSMLSQIMEKLNGT